MSNFPQRQLATIRVSGITEMCNNKQERHKHSFVITKKGMYYLVDGRKVTERDFELMYPLTMVSNMKPTMDTTKII